MQRCTPENLHFDSYLRKTKIVHLVQQIQGPARHESRDPPHPANPPNVVPQVQVILRCSCSKLKVEGPQFLASSPNSEPPVADDWTLRVRCLPPPANTDSESIKLTKPILFF